MWLIHPLVNMFYWEGTLTTTALSQRWPDAWRECAADFLQHIYEKSHSSSSYESYKGMLFKFFSTVRKMPDLVSRQDIEAFLRKRFDGRTQPLSTAARNQRIAILASFYSYAASYTIPGPAGPQPLFQRPSPLLGFHAGRPSRRYRALSEQEITRLFSVIPDTVQGLRDKALYLTFFLTTRRRGEILRLKWGDIERGLIRDDQGRVYEGYLYHFRNKGSSQIDDVAELPQEAYRAIERYLLASGRLSSIAADDPIFTGVGLPNGKGKMSAPGMPLSGVTVLQNLKKYARMAGLDFKRVCVHSWRHSAVQIRLQAGQMPLDIMKITRHRSLDAFMIYTRGLVGTSDPFADIVSQRFKHLTP